MKSSTDPIVAATPQSRPAGPVRWLGQFLLYGLFALVIGVFTQWPPYHPIGEDEALIKVSVARLGQPVGECRRLSDEELAKLPPNMRDPIRCPRERSPLSMEVHVNGARMLQRVAEPGGLSKDGAAAIYERLVVSAGKQRISVRFNDDVRPGARVYEHDANVTLVPGQVLVIDFDAEKGGIVLL
ncbi:hypothetical protein [Parapusillimonas granuli]|uniref:Uncharacterized protein n=1 Tax=Parapusillimonas granuli TaxID=380911 RepID=A0A853G3N4_9BURK|nr:hypothetical protein [Parapusillimonas granuli]MBB5215020.1 hypothetical protein [Parapusillimonas granuli]MEB2401126.1 hypothetical protein [Alcaligenaceae bacterium]NYT49341.1 hypothetical protein [Parapusillimonas granuli]